MTKKFMKFDPWIRLALKAANIYGAIKTFEVVSEKVDLATGLTASLSMIAAGCNGVDVIVDSFENLASQIKNSSEDSGANSSQQPSTEKVVEN